MTDHAYPVEVQSDFLEKITRAQPVQAVAEFIWNGLDADATSIDVRIEYNDLNAMSAIVITDNGLGMPFSDAPELFKKLGGSWKRPGAVTKKDGRFLHGQDGRGRFKAFSLGRFAEWDVTYPKGDELSTFKITMNAGKIQEVRISDEAKAPEEKKRGVTLTISELHKDYRSITSETGIQEFTEIFALYLADYQGISIVVDSTQIDPDKAIASRHTVNLSDISEEDKNYPIRLEIIEWRAVTSRALYLCNEKGFPLTQVERRFHTGNYQFSAYLKSSYISKLQKEGTLELAEMNSAVIAVIDEAQQAIRDYFRNRAAQEAKTVVEDWKEEKIYPYEGEAVTNVEHVERQVFDIVAVNVAQYIPEFETTPTKNKAFHLRLLRQAIEKSPEELQLILGEVLKLPKRKQEELAELLRDVSLSSIISAAKIVADRLKFLTGLEAILFDADSKKRLKERSQLHRIIAENCWLFGEEYNLSVDDQSLTEVLRKHRKILGDDIVINDPVKHISKERGIIDLMLSRSIRHHKADELTHLVVELKAPKVKINQKEITQIEEYTISVTKDERFRSVNTNWVFWVISDDYGDYASYRMTDSNNNGRIHTKDNCSIYVKTWAQVLNQNRARLQFFQESLEYQADKGASLKHLQEHYAKFLKGVLTEETTEEVATT
ncbi:MAG: ATP-binding protein [Sulfuricaulis sp.]|uniref:ATP-binding protein n=1 Tax=Sulfuricaulis sp. TaxID=2003553 RepID=UPI0025CE6C8F|nr:ATP-binding protein [Sulfuricaulis sp.]MCR4345883.1 ATP-binding protein [Sulfuricaulis sp.]